MKHVSLWMLLWLLLFGCSAPQEAPMPAEPPTPTPSLVDTMTVEEKVAQLFCIVPEALDPAATTAVTPALKEQLAEYPVGGFVLFAGNIKTPEQTKQFTHDLKQALPYTPLVAVDEEGGLVSRIGANPAMGYTKESSARTTSDTYAMGQRLGAMLTELGFNTDFAPVADVDTNPDNPVIGDRAFASDAEEAAQKVAQCTEGLRSQKVLATLKHFPGHGDTALDTHTGQASVSHTRERLEQVELVPFASGIEAGAELVMVAHISVPNVTGSLLPATMSPELIAILKNQLGFEGIVITDSLAMGAVTQRFGPGEACVRALLAGCDMLLMPADFSVAYEAVLAAVKDGTIPQERLDDAVLRIMNVKTNSLS